MVKERVVVKHENEIPKGLKLGKNKIMEDGKVVRIRVETFGQFFKDSSAQKKQYKITEWR